MSHLHNMTVILFMIATWIPESFDFRINLVDNPKFVSTQKIESKKSSNTAINY